MNTTYITKDTTYIAEVDGQFANELHDLVTAGGADEKRAMFALNLASNSIDDTVALASDEAAYIMNEYVGSLAIRNYDHLVDMLATRGNLNATDVAFLKSDFTLVDDVLCTCDACDAR
jgi:hypothetical protein